MSAITADFPTETTLTNPSELATEFGGNPIVETALRLFLAKPDTPALQILDTAMKGYEGNDDPAFESWELSVRRPYCVYVDELEPPSLFSDIIRRAFAPELDPRELSLLSLVDETDDSELQERIAAVSDEWQRAILRFAERYRLWEP